MSNANAFLTILGSNSAKAVYGRYPSAQYLSIDNQSFLLDCGEGTQFQLEKYKCKLGKINTILITHLHGDHVFGLFGLLSSFQLNGRIKPLTIVGPAALKALYEMTFQITGQFISYPVNIIQLSEEQWNLDEKKVVLKLDNITIEAFRLIHRVPCFGYLIRKIPKRRNISRTFIKTANPTVDEIKSIINGADYVTKEGIKIKNDDITMPSGQATSYAYCTDTRYNPALFSILEGTKTIYHESTYLDDLRLLAQDRYHSTTLDAARVAKNSKAERLIIGHYSSRYKDITEFKTEAESVFSNTELAEEGRVFEL